MSLIEEHSFLCPYCGSENLFLTEHAQSAGTCVQDCEICCRPINITIRVGLGGALDITAQRENE